MFYCIVPHQFTQPPNRYKSRLLVHNKRAFIYVSLGNFYFLHSQIRKIVKKVLFLALLCFIGELTKAQDEALEKAGLLLDRCSFEPTAEVMVLRDEAELSVNNDYTLRFDRHVTYKFFKDHKIDKALGESIFYPCADLIKYYKLSVRAVELDPTNKALLPRDYTSRIMSTHIEQLSIRFKAGSILEVSYSLNFPFDGKLSDWRFQSQYPTELSSLKIVMPEVVKLTASLVGGYEPEVQRSSEAVKPFRLNNQTQNLKVSERFYQLNQLPSAMPEAFADHSHGQLARMRMHVTSVMKGGDVKDDFLEGQIQHIFETLSAKPDFFLRLVPPLEIKSEYDKRIRTLIDPIEKLTRIYDLVRRHITWDRIDTLSAPHQLSKVWSEKKGNSTEINLVLIKLLQTYGYEAAPLIVSTRSNGPIDTDEVALTDFNRTVAHVRLANKSIVLDATGKFCDFPTIPSAILNTRGLLISVDKDRWVNIRDTTSLYKNSVTLLGHLSGDSSFLTNVYVNSYGYAKPEHVDILETDSLKGLCRYFERGNKAIQLKHFIAANEWVDTLPLAQEFDIKVPLAKNDNLTGITPTWFAIPDTLFSITENRKSEVNFGYRQEYDLVSEFTFPERYELYLLPNNLKISALNGSVRFEREFHPGGTNFSLKQSLYIDRSVFTKSESLELAKFLKKIATLNAQQVMLKRNY